MRCSRTTLLVATFACAISLLAQNPITQWKAKADAGDVRAQVALAHAYEKGEGVAQNDELAAKWYRAAAEKGDPEAQNSLGVFYRLGRGVEQDKPKAVEWYRKAAKQGYGPAMFNLGTAYYNGDGVNISDEYAYSWFVLAQRGGSKDAPDAVSRMEVDLPPEQLDRAKIVLAGIVSDGKEAPKDESLALALLKQVADRDPGSQFEIGCMFAEGKGAPQNSAEAVRYLTASKSLSAQEYLADMYLEGRGVPRDTKKGVEILNKIAGLSRDRSSDAFFKLADMYWSGNFVSKDYKQALNRYTKAADLGYPHALFMLGTAYRDGSGVRRDADLSCMYIMLAAAVGSSEIQRESLPNWCPAKPDKARDKAKKWLESHRAVAWAIQQHAREMQKNISAADQKVGNISKQ